MTQAPATGLLFCLEKNCCKANGIVYNGHTPIKETAAMTLMLDLTRQHGKEAFEQGLPPAVCPFYRNTDHGKAWMQGYETARGPLPKLGPLEYPALSYDGSAHISTKTHKLGQDRFAAVGALYFRGYRGMYVSAVGNTRRAAEKAVMAILDPDPNAAFRSESRLRAMGG